MFADLYFVEASFNSDLVISYNNITAERGAFQLAYLQNGYPTFPGEHVCGMHAGSSRSHAPRLTWSG